MKPRHWTDIDHAIRGKCHLMKVPRVFCSTVLRQKTFVVTKTRNLLYALVRFEATRNRNELTPFLLNGLQVASATHGVSVQKC